MPSALDVAGISAVVSAFVSTFANALLRWGGRALYWLRRVTQADHTAIGGVPTINNVLPDRVGVYVAFGPARRRRSDEIDLDKAIDFVQANFGSWFPDKPEYAAPGHGVRFLVKDSSPAGADNVTMQVHIVPNGRVELYWAVDASADPDDVRADWLPLADLMWPLALLWSSIGPAYRRLGCFPLRSRRRFDWYFSIGTHLTRGPESFTRFWKIQFPGRQALRASDNISSCPANGSPSELRSFNYHRGWSPVATTALTRLLKYNGYYRCEAAIQDAIAVVGRRLQAPSTDVA
jgi:hypothetical protein